MKTVYSVLCPFDGNSTEASDAAWRAALAWIDKDLINTALGVTEGTDERETRIVRWWTLEKDVSSVRRLEHRIPPSATSVTGWVTNVWVCRDGERSWGIVRSGPENPAGVVTTLRFDAHRPRVISEWLQNLVVVRDGLQLSERALNYGMNDTERLLKLMLDPQRQIPIVGISTVVIDDRQRPLVSPNDLAYRLAANAHVIVLDRALCWRITETIGRPLSVYNGAVRLWWPQMTPDDDPYRHTLVMPDRIRDDVKRAEQHIVRRVWNAACDALGPPPLEARLRAARSREESERRIAEFRTRAADAEELLEAFQEEQEETVRLREQINELLAENEDLRDALAAAEVGADEEAEDAVAEIDSVEDAVRLAAAEATNVVYLQSAFDAARESGYPNPQQVLRDLRAIHRVAAKWAVGDLPGGFEEAFKAEAVRFQPGIGQLAATKYRTDYEIEYGGRTVMMGPHLRRGVGAPNNILRIYWFVDDHTKQLIIGHVGRKLRDASHN